MGRGKIVSLARIVVSQLPGARQRGLLRAGSLEIPCRLGRRGILHAKREGDLGTPAGRFHLAAVFYRADRLARPRSLLPIRPLAPRDGWCDDPASASYNYSVRLPFAARHENLWRKDRLYDLLVTLDHNRRPRVRGLGSAIFLHVAAPDGKPTAGCVAISPAALRRLLARLSSRTLLVIR
jgi:L,D-peptidoglycan transpeptidase YkuD (ErfK/YbiS/YcfS/YnhG family)